MQVVGRPARRARPEPRHRAGAVLEVPGEVLAAERLRGGDGRDAPGERGAAQRRDAVGGVDDRRDPLEPLDLGLDPVRLRRRRGRSPRAAARRCSHDSASSIRSVPRHSPVEGMTFATRPASIFPQTSAAPVRGSSRRPSTAGTSVTTLARAKTRSSVSCGREVWPPRPCSVTATWSRGRRQRSLAQTDLPDVDARVAVHGEDAVDALERPGGDRLERPAGHDLLGGLEDRPHRDAALGEGVLDRPQREHGTDERGRVHVVAARVAHAGVARGEVEPRPLAARGGRPCRRAGRRGTPARTRRGRRAGRSRAAVGPAPPRRRGVARRPRSCASPRGTARGGRGGPAGGR